MPLDDIAFNSSLPFGLTAFAAREAAAALEAPVVAGTDGGLGAAITAARVAANFAYSAINTINEVLDMVDNVLSVAKTNVNLDNVKGTIGKSAFSLKCNVSYHTAHIPCPFYTTALKVTRSSSPTR